METLSVSRFKATCLAVLENVRQQKKKIVITKRGKPIAQISPIVEERKEVPLKHTVTFLGDVVSPVAKEDWEALK